MWRLALPILALGQDSDIENLHHKDADVRRAAAVILGLKKSASAIPALIEGLRDSVPDVRAACYEALVRITGRKFLPDDVPSWKDWWDREGRREFPAAAGDPRQVSREVETAVARFEKSQQQVEKKLTEVESRMNDAERRIELMSIIMMGLGFIFLIVMFYFVGHISSRIKEWKDLMRRAETYVSEAKVVTERIDAISDEVDRKKAEVYELFAKMREEAEEEVSRFADVLQQNSDHRLRGEVMELRQRAEKELQATLAELKTQMEHQARRILEDARARFEKFVGEASAGFHREVEAHRTFLEGAFYASNGRLDDAVRSYRRVLEISPRNVVAWIRLGDCYRESLQHEDAIEAYRNALEISPNDPRAAYSMATVFARLRHRDKMLEYLRRAAAHDGEYKDEALNDPAFQEYWNDPAFKDIAEA